MARKLARYNHFDALSDNDDEEDEEEKEEESVEEIAALQLAIIQAKVLMRWCWYWWWL
jgi:hypothetical protein